MSERVVVTIHLPLEMGAVSRVMRAVATAFPDARVASPDGAGMRIQADDDPRLTTADRRRIARDRQRKPAGDEG